MHPAGIVGKIAAAGIRNPVLLAPAFEMVQVPVLPAHRHPEDVMQLGKQRIAPHQHAPDDVRADADQVNLELIDRCQAVIAGSGRRRNGWGHRFHR